MFHVMIAQIHVGDIDPDVSVVEADNILMAELHAEDNFRKMNNLPDRAKVNVVCLFKSMDRGRVRKYYDAFDMLQRHSHKD